MEATISNGEVLVQTTLSQVLQEVKLQLLQMCGLAPRPVHVYVNTADLDADTTSAAANDDSGESEKMSAPNSAARGGGGGGGSRPAFSSLSSPLVEDDDDDDNGESCGEGMEDAGPSPSPSSKSNNNNKNKNKKNVSAECEGGQVGAVKKTVQPKPTTVAEVGSSSRAPPQPIRLDALTEEDWDVILYPVSELRSYLLSSSASVKRTAGGNTTTTTTNGCCGAQNVAPTSFATSSGTTPLAVIEDYMKCRCAELPMRLQLESLLIHRHEHLLRQHMKELIQLSEFVTCCGELTPTLVVEEAHSQHAGLHHGRGSGARAPQVVSESGYAPHFVKGAARSALGASSSFITPPTTPMMTTSAQDPAIEEMERLASVEDTHRRLARCRARIAELEQLVLREAQCKVRCCQRMVLLSEMTKGLVNRVNELRRAALKACAMPAQPRAALGARKRCCDDDEESVPQQEAGTAAPELKRARTVVAV